MIGTLPHPRNKQSKQLLQGLVNRLSLRPVKVRQSTGHDCIFCGKAIEPGEQYRDAGYAAKAHETCFKGMAEGLK